MGDFILKLSSNTSYIYTGINSILSVYVIGFRRTMICVACLCLLLAGCGEELLNMEQARNRHYAVRVENVDFDVPLLYHPLEGRFDKGWEPPQTERETIDAIRIKALLPDMEMYNEKTANEFKTPGWSRKVMIMMTHYRVNWPYYFDGAYKRLIKLPEHPLVPGMFHYRDPKSDMKDIYLSHDKPVRDLTEMRCENPELDPEPAPSPSCKVTTIYRGQFQLDYAFSLAYLSQWREIDQKIKALLDSFISAESKNQPQI
ncbi:MULTISPECIES: hypothetical protein [Methylomonas]|uniref:hypothetical protein n=1 Tax=Methylomonas TaxID=416 RepID=UPI0012319AE9|nr:hypothetical protein [Methylomonas rhizoryzae]